MGIKEQDKAKLFKLFGSINTETVNKNGIGLGLVICQKIVAKFDGIIDFISEYQKGTTFFFTFEIDEFMEDFEMEDRINSNRNFSLPSMFSFLTGFDNS